MLLYQQKRHTLCNTFWHSWYIENILLQTCIYLSIYMALKAVKPRQKMHSVSPSPRSHLFPKCWASLKPVRFNLQHYRQIPCFIIDPYALRDIFLTIKWSFICRSCFMIYSQHFCQRSSQHYIAPLLMSKFFFQRRFKGGQHWQIGDTLISQLFRNLTDMHLAL